MDPRVVQVEVVLALPERAHEVKLALAPGATVGDALKKAMQSADFAGLGLSEAPVGIFGRITGRDQILNQGDRLEIYRPLAADPKTARRKRVASKSVRS
jgi:uncharacterized protein